MVISIDDSLIDLKKYLKKIGYDVHNKSENVVSDVYIYSEKNTGLANLYDTIEANEGGSFLIDADGKTFDEIINCINHRLYTSLF